METSSHPRARRSHSAPKREGKKTIAKATEPRRESQGRRNRAALRLLHEWLSDGSGYDEETWPQLKQALESNRSSSSRTLFHD